MKIYETAHLRLPWGEAWRKMSASMHLKKLKRATFATQINGKIPYVSSAM